MTVSLKPELEKLIDDEIKSGRAADSGEFLNKAVYHYIVSRDLGLEYTQEEIDGIITEGLNDLERGDVIEGEEAFRQLRAHSLERRRRQA